MKLHKTLRYDFWMNFPFFYTFLRFFQRMFCEYQFSKRLYNKNMWKNTPKKCSEYTLSSKSFIIHAPEMINEGSQELESCTNIEAIWSVGRQVISLAHSASGSAFTKLLDDFLVQFCNKMFLENWFSQIIDTNKSLEYFFMNILKKSQNL